MSIRRLDRTRTARLIELAVADDPTAWQRAGFDLEADDSIVIDGIVIRPVGRAAGRGIVEWTIAGLPVSVADNIDGLPTQFLAGPLTEPAADPPAGPPGRTGGIITGAEHAAAEAPATTRAASGPQQANEPAAPAHPNGVIGIDHIVLATPNLERTLAAFAELQLPCLRIRETTAPDGSPLRQGFLRLGPTIVEIISGPPVTDGTDGTDPAAAADDALAGMPASFWGLAVDVEDLDVTAAVLGEGLGRVKPAVQDGRRIATLRKHHFDLSVAVAAMDHRQTT